MKPWLRTILLIVFSLIFLVSAYIVLDYYLESRKQKSEFDQLAQIMDQSANAPRPTAPPDNEPEDPQAPTEPEGPLLVETTDPETGEIVRIQPEFVDLYQLNNDIVGWISIPGTLINYPVMQNKTIPTTTST